MPERKLLYSQTDFGIMPPPIKSVTGKTFDLVYTHIMYNTRMNVRETLSLRIFCNFHMYLILYRILCLILEIRLFIEAGKKI